MFPFKKYIIPKKETTLPAPKPRVKVEFKPRQKDEIKENSEVAVEVKQKQHIPDYENIILTKDRIISELEHKLRVQQEQFQYQIDNFNQQLEMYDKLMKLALKTSNIMFNTQ